MVFDEVAREGHEQILYGYDEVSGLRTIIAIHSTALGPALGGTRFFPYESEDGRPDRRPPPRPGA